jgi:hypothetical protein
MAGTIDACWFIWPTLVLSYSNTYMVWSEHKNNLQKFKFVKRNGTCIPTPVSEQKIFVFIFLIKFQDPSQSVHNKPNFHVGVNDIIV